MADNITTTTTVSAPPDGTVIATDQVGTAHFQKVKLVDGTADSSTAIPGDATNGLDVDVTRLPAIPAGTNNIGDVDVLTIAAGDNNIGNVDIVSLPALAAGTNNIGDVDVLSIAAGDNNIGNVDIASAIPAGTNNIGDVDVLSMQDGGNSITVDNGGTFAVQAVARPETANGLDIFRSLDIDETEEEVKATAGQVYGWFIYNNAASTRYVKFYNATAANVTVGTTTPVLTLPIPAGSAANMVFAIGIAFGTAITVAATTGVLDNDTGAPSANDVVIDILYK